MLRIFRALTHGSLSLLVFLLPLFFVPWTVDILELNKQTLLVILTLMACLSWLGSMLLERAFVFRKHWLNILPVAFLASVVWSATSSDGGFLSWVGNSTQEYTSVLTIAALVLLFFLVSNTCGTEAERKRLSVLFVFSATIATLIGLGATFSLLPWTPPTGQLVVFNTVGTLNALAILSIAATMISIGLFVFEKASRALGIMAASVCTTSFALLLVLDYWMLWVILLSGLATLFVFALMRAKDLPNQTRFLLPALLCALAVLLLFVNIPGESAIPVEVSPSTETSWEIAKATFNDNPSLTGSGPGTYLFDYSRYRPVEVNETPFWEIRFDRASSHVLTMIATLGVLGTILFLLFCIAILFKTVAFVLRPKEPLTSPAILLCAWVPLTVASALYSSNLTLAFSFFFFSGLLASVDTAPLFTKRFSQSPRLGLLASSAFVLASIGIVTMLFVAAQRYAAEVAFAQAVAIDRADGDLQVITEKLDQAASLNRFNDIYYRNLSQALLLAVQERLGDLSAEQLTSDARSYIQALTAASINASVRATELGPRNVANWLTRGATYREFASVIGNAGQFAIEAFERAVELEPANPVNHTELGKTHLIVAEQTRPLLAAEDPAVQKEAQSTLTEHLKLAEASFVKAIELKPDYAPAHYQLALTFERQGRLNDAIGKMESVAQYNPLDVGVAFQLGVLYLRRGGAGDQDRAKAAFERAIELVPAYSNARWFLASIYEQQGNLETAIEQVEYVFNLNPENDLVRARLERLKAGLAAAELPPPIEEGEQTATSVPEAQSVQ